MDNNDEFVNLGKTSPSCAAADRRLDNGMVPLDLDVIVALFGNEADGGFSRDSTLVKHRSSSSVKKCLEAPESHFRDTRLCGEKVVEATGFLDV